ncbi:MAG: hypothetical protein LBL66_08660 [Clostridiales bacterium]|jgi:hypothetical protein|nr:hypothetical protein [Clostridiales bacterium]
MRNGTGTAAKGAGTATGRKSGVAWVITLFLAIVLVVASLGGTLFAAADEGGETETDTNAFTYGLTFNDQVASTPGQTIAQMNAVVQTKIDAVNAKIRGIIADLEAAAGEGPAPTATDKRNALDEEYIKGNIPFFSRLGMTEGGTFEVTIANKEGEWDRFDSEVLMQVRTKQLNDGSDATGGGRATWIHYNFGTDEAVFVSGPLQQLFSKNEKKKLSGAVSDHFFLDGDNHGFFCQNFLNGYLKYPLSKMHNGWGGKHDGYYHFGVDNGQYAVYGKHIDEEGAETDIDLPKLLKETAGTIGANGFVGSRAGLTHPQVASGEKTNADVAALFVAAYDEAVAGTTYGTPYIPGYPIMAVRQDFGHYGHETGPGNLGDNYVQRFIYGDSETQTSYAWGGVSYLIWNVALDEVFIVRDGFLDTLSGGSDPYNSEALGAPYGNDFVYDGNRYQNFGSGYIKITGEDRAAGTATIVLRQNINAVTGEPERAPGLALTIALHESRDILAVNGHGIKDITAAFAKRINDANLAIEGIQEALKAELAGEYTDEALQAALAQAVADGKIPFYTTAANGLLTSANVTAFGESWTNTNIKNQVLVLEGLAEGYEQSYRSPKNALLAYNGKSGEAVLVTGAFAVAWNQGQLGMPLADSFTATDGNRYQNFSRGYIKVETDEGGDFAATVLNKNYDADANAETAADPNGAGWMGAARIEGNRLPFLNDDAEVLEFTAALSDYYDSWTAKGFNIGYSEKMYFEGTDIRGMEAFYCNHYTGGDSVAKPYGDSDRANWSSIAYNTELKQFFLITDEILRVMEYTGGSNGNQYGSLEIGMPVGEVLTVRSGSLAARYQVFENGYIRVTGERADNPGGERVTVYKAVDEGYESLAGLLAGAINAITDQYAADGGLGEGGYAFGWDAFEDIYGRIGAIEDLSAETEAALAELLEEYAAAYGALITASSYEALTEVSGEVGGTTNGAKDYTPASFAAFDAARSLALALDDGTQGAVDAKIAALNAAKALLVTTAEAYAEAQAAIDAITENTGDMYTTDSWANFIGAKAAAATMPDGTNAEMEVKTTVIALALAGLEYRQEMAALTVTSGANFEAGTDIALIASGGDGNGKVVFSIVAGGTGEGSITNNVLTVTKVGTIIVKAVKAGGSDYYDGDSGDYTITIVKAATAKPDAPLAAATQNSVTVDAVWGAEYRLGETGEWQDGTEFTDLDAGTEYVIYVRIKETDFSYASEAVSVTVSTEKAESGKGCASCGTVMGADILGIGGALAVMALAVALCKYVGRWKGKRELRIEN